MAKRTIAALAAAFLVFAAFAAVADTELSFTDWATRAFNYYPLATVTKVTDNRSVGLVYIDCPVFYKDDVESFCATMFEYVKIHYPNMNEFVSFWKPNTGITYKVYHERAVRATTPDPAAHLYATPEPTAAPGTHYVLNKNSKKFHIETCRSASEIKEKNREDFYGTREAVIEQGYAPCKLCNP